MRWIVLMLAATVCFQMQAQDLPGFQKLRGSVLSTTPDDDYTRHKYNAFDTNRGTHFMARDVGGWVGLDLGVQQVIRRVRVFPMPDRHDQFNGAIFQGADNPEFNNPTNLFTVTQGLTPGQYATYTITNTQAFRYVRCINFDHRCSVAELEFYADTDAQTVLYPQLTNLPTVYLETKGNFDFVNKENWVSSQVGRVVVVGAPSAGAFSAEIRGRGNSTWEFMDKKPFRIRFPDGESQNFLGLPAKARNWTLIANAVDKTMLRNALAFEISKALGFEYTPPAKMVDVVLDGFYYGAYMASDHIQVNQYRINIDEIVASDVTLPNLSGGYHLEIDAYAADEEFHFYTPRGVPFTIQSPDIYHPIAHKWIEDHIKKTEALLFEDPDLAVERYIDLESAVKYYIHSELTGNCDAYWCIPCYKKRNDDKLYFGPVWDYDQAFLTNNRVPKDYETLNTQHGSAQPWFRQIMKTNAAKKKLQSIWQQVKDDNLKQQLFDYLDENAALLQKSQALNFERWNSLNRKVWFEDALFNSYQEYIDFVKWFIEFRFEWYDDIVRERQVQEIILTTAANGWRYTLNEPAKEWNQKEFDDKQWAIGQAPFGTEQNLQNTNWTTDKIFIRTYFDIEKDVLDSIDKAYFTIWHDEDCQIYLNGSLALELKGYLTAYRTFEFDKTLLMEGTNTIAVKCIQTVGGQLIDVGISALMFEKEIIDPCLIDPCSCDPCSCDPCICDPCICDPCSCDPCICDPCLCLTDPCSIDECCNEPKPTGSFDIEDGYYCFVQNGVLTIRGLNNEKVALYGIDGRIFMLRQANGDEIQYALPVRGIYIVRIEGKVIKIAY